MIGQRSHCSNYFHPPDCLLRNNLLLTKLQQPNSTEFVFNFTYDALNWFSLETVDFQLVNGMVLLQSNANTLKLQ